MAYFSELAGPHVHWQDYVILVFPTLFLPFAFWLFTYQPPSGLKSESPSKASSATFSQSQFLQIMVTGVLGAVVLQFNVAGLVQKLAAGVVGILLVLIAFWANDRLRK